MNFRSLLWPLLIAALIFAASGLLVPSLSVLLLVFAGLLFGVFINGLADFATRHSPLSYRLAFALVVTVLLLMIGGGIYYLGAQMVQHVDELWSQLQTSLQDATERLRQYKFSKQYLPDSEQVQTLMSQQGESAVASLMGGLRSVGWAMTGAIVIFFVGAYAAYEPRLYCRGLTKLFPKERRGRVSDVLEQLRSALGRWIVGRVMSMTLVGILTAIGLWFLDVPLPITLGVVAALLTFIPNIGPLLAAVPQVLLALNVGTETAIYVIIFNLALQGIESYLITPMIQRHEVTLPPILTIAAQLWMGVIAGVIGIMMAAPLVVVLMVLIQMLYIHDRLGDSHPGELTTD
ncbi:AI-2E family transporter [Novipirellula caenicola]|uniref:Transport protein Rv0205 n=1 Tax=Novipirellula caenicola TaxID=1536901 RepID=A0ABP9VIE0_9BACT